MKTLKTALGIVFTGMLFVQVPETSVAQSTDDVIYATLQKYLPGTSNLGSFKVRDTKIDAAKKKITANVDVAAAYIPFTQQSLETFKNDVRQSLGSGYADYDVVISVVRRDKSGAITSSSTFDDLALFAPKNMVAPTETKQFITRLDAEPNPGGLDGKNIAVWQSHGWYFEPKLNRWEWQRARIFQTVEDLFTQSYVMPYLMPMLENAGANVISPRERDINVAELIIDNDGSKTLSGSYSEKGQWQNASLPGFKFAETIKDFDNPFRSGTARKASAIAGNEAKWFANIPADGTYAVYVSYTAEPENTAEAIYTVNSKDGAKHFKVNQQMGGGTWIYLGHFPFAKDQQELPIVTLTGQGGDGQTISADAVKIGGGMGNVARKVGKPLDDIDYDYVLSNYPRFTEAARYFMQWAGVPDSVYTPSGNITDYNDDYKSRGLWVNWLAGGSSVLPDRKGLKIPVDLSLAWHSDAGTTLNDSIIGTLGIYSTAGDKYVNGTDRMASRDLTDLIVTQIVDDIRAQFEPNWTRRGMWDQSYFEARVPQVPSMLLEFLSHQNFADMKYGLDPNFRFLVSRAVYKGILKFLAHRDGKDYVVQPLPVKAFEITGGNAGKYTLTWQPTADTLEATANPTYYYIEQRTNDGGFTLLEKVTKSQYTLSVTDNDIHSYRIVAGNDGGLSFPSEVLSLCYMPGKNQVNIVNGFTRVSAPDWFDSGEIAGFYDTRDHGVPYVNDISFIGSMFEYRRNIPWMDDDAAGFGASRANFEDKVIAGNTFDFVYTHGKAIRNSGMGFISTSVDAFMNSNDNTTNIVDLILGKQKEIQQGRGAYGTYYKAYPEPLQKRIKTMAEQGTSFFISGAYVATDIWDNPFSSPQVADADQKFATDVLGYHWRVGQASVTGQAYEVASRFRQFNGGDFDFSAELNPEIYAVESPDSFYPADDKKGATIMRYTENNLIAGTAFDNYKYRTVVIGFPFETIKDAASRNKLMKQVLDFFSAPKTQSPKATDKPKKKSKKK